MMKANQPPRRETRTRPTKRGIYECVFWGEDGANGVLGFSPRVDSCDEIVTNDDDTPSPHEILALLDFSQESLLEYFLDIMSWTSGVCFFFLVST
jgi:hypothetical protein